MPALDPYVVVTGVPSGANATATLTAQMFARKLTGLTVNGPRGVAVEVYVGSYAPSARIDQSLNGFSNTAEYPNARAIPAGRSVIVVWPGQSANATQCSATFIQEVA